MSMLRNRKKGVPVDEKLITNTSARRRADKNHEQVKSDCKNDVADLNAEYIKYRALFSNASIDDVLSR